MDAVFFRRWLGLVAGLVLALPVWARVHHAVPAAVAPDQMSVQIKRDRLTLLLAKFPQVYLSGPLDAAAPGRFQALLQSGQIPDGSDLYLDSTAGDLAAGLALGRLFHQHGLVTHIGARPRPGGLGASHAARTASCVDACVYAYLGGLYRWAPSGTDRIGLHRALLPAAQPALGAYLAALGLSQRQLAAVMLPPQGDMVWWDGERMLPWMVANNGRLPLVASFETTPQGPQLTYLQTVREGRHRVLLSCRRGAVELLAVDELGARRSLNVWPRVGSTYFEINHQPLPGPSGPSPQRLGAGLQFGRRLDLAQVAAILQTESLGAWMRDRNGAVRYGFTIGPVTVRNSTQFFLGACRDALQAGNGRG